MIKHEKGWGYELWLHNDEKYCFKILCFTKVGNKFSLHFHLKKTETWYIISGKFIVETIDPKTAKRAIVKLVAGDTFHLEPGTPHRLVCLDVGSIAEASTQHFEDDSYRIEPGDSQK